MEGDIVEIGKLLCSISPFIYLILVLMLGIDIVYHSSCGS